MVSRFLAHPATRGLDLDSPETTNLRRQIVRSKPFLRAIYDEWYRMLVEHLPGGSEPVLELGAGGGFMGEHITGVITSDVFEVEGIDSVIDARWLPLRDDTLRAIVMTNVLHHIPDVGRFLTESQRVLKPGGRIVMIEPWNTGWSRFVHKHFHNEAMEPAAAEWRFPETGPLSAANAALPWIVFERDRAELGRGWPGLRVSEITPFMPFRYLASGGVSMRSLQPGWMFPVWKSAERLFHVERSMAVFALIVVERVD